MLCYAENPTTDQYTLPPLLASTGRTFSGSASSMKIRVSEQRLPGRLAQKYASIHSLMSEIIDRNIPAGLTGYVKEPPRLILTVDRRESIDLDRKIESYIKNITIQETITADITFKGQLEDLQTNLGLSITQLAQFFGVTRKSIYDWLDGTAPRTANTRRLDIMSAIIAANGDRINLKRLKGVWLTSVNGQSFMDIISEDSLGDEEKIAKASLKLAELAPRLGPQAKQNTKTYLGNAHSSDIDRVADFG